jgi:hypothetical protein
MAHARRQEGIHGDEGGADEIEGDRRATTLAGGVLPLAWTPNRHPASRAKLAEALQGTA